MSQSLNAKPNIFICGLSWTRGEYASGSPTIQHKGLEQYFIDAGYNVFNVSRSNSFHNQVIDALTVSMSEHYRLGDLVFFQQTKTRDILFNSVFHPDGNHPNRNGHKILFDHIVKKLNL